MRTRQFWVDTGERAVRTFAQALVAAITAGLVVTDIAQWKAALIASGFAAVLSVLMSLAGTRVGDDQSPAFFEEAA